jgi:hypothetical protein
MGEELLALQEEAAAARGAVADAEGRAERGEQLLRSEMREVRPKLTAGRRRAGVRACGAGLGASRGGGRWRRCWRRKWRARRPRAPRCATSTRRCAPSATPRSTQAARSPPRTQSFRSFRFTKSRFTFADPGARSMSARTCARRSTRGGRRARLTLTRAARAGRGGAAREGAGNALCPRRGQGRRPGCPSRAVQRARAGRPDLAAPRAPRRRRQLRPPPAQGGVDAPKKTTV